MPKILRFLPALAALLLGTAPVHGADPVLVRLESVVADKRVKMPVSIKPGAAAAPAFAQLPERWFCLPGDAIKADARPADRAVELYQGQGVERSLLALLEIRYYPAGSGKWLPQFRLQETPLVRRDAQGRWQPITTLGGAAGAIMLIGATVPNTEGYYPRLEFSIANGRTAIDGWVVR